MRPHAMLSLFSPPLLRKGGWQGSIEVSECTSTNSLQFRDSISAVSFNVPVVGQKDNIKELPANRSRPQPTVFTFYILLFLIIKFIYHKLVS